MVGNAELKPLRFLRGENKRRLDYGVLEGGAFLRTFAFARFTSRENSACAAQSVILKMAPISFQSNPTLRSCNIIRPRRLSNRAAFSAPNRQSSRLDDCGEPLQLIACS
jgi:hypothetical protein